MPHHSWLFKPRDIPSQISRECLEDDDQMTLASAFMTLSKSSRPLPSRNVSEERQCPIHLAHSGDNQHLMPTRHTARLNHASSTLPGPRGRRIYVEYCLVVEKPIQPYRYSYRYS